MIGQPYTAARPGRDCPRCHGEGEVTFNPSWPFDPQEETSEMCRACNGTGIQHSRKEPRNEQDQDHDDRDHPVRLDVAAGRRGSPVVLELVHTRVRALTTGLTCGGVLATLLTRAVTSP